MVSKDTIREVLHMYITELETPAVLLDLDIAEKNLQTYQQACDKYKKSL